MGTRRTWKLSMTVALAALVALPCAALGQDDMLDDDDDIPMEDVSSSDLEEPAKAQIGVGFRLRQLVIPKGLIELFVERASSGASHTGFGGELIRRKGNFEMSFGVEWEALNPDDGVWVDKGDQIPMDDPDLVNFDGFAWLGFDVNFIWQNALHEKVAIRYGAGLGVGVILGDVLRTDYVCPATSTNDSDLDSECTQDPNAVNIREPEDDIPPVFPIINFIVGAQFRPMENLAINVETGLRTVPFFGITVAYFI